MTICVQDREQFLWSSFLNPKNIVEKHKIFNLIKTKQIRFNVISWISFVVLSMDPYKPINYQKSSAEQVCLNIVQSKFSSVDFCADNLIKCWK